MLQECMQCLIEHEFPVQLRTGDIWNSRCAVEDYLAQIVGHMALLGRSFAAFKQSVIDGCLSHHIRWKDVAAKYMERRLYPRFLYKAKFNPARTWKLVILYDNLKIFEPGSFCYLPFWPDYSIDCPGSIYYALAIRDLMELKPSVPTWLSQLRLDNIAVGDFVELHPVLLPYITENLLPYQVTLPREYKDAEFQEIYKDVISRITVPPLPRSPTVAKFRGAFELEDGKLQLPAPIRNIFSHTRTSICFEHQEAAYFAKAILEKCKTGAFFKDIRNHSAHNEEIGSRSQVEIMQKLHVQRAQDSMEVKAPTITKDRTLLGEHRDEVRESCSDRTIHHIPSAAGTRSSSSFRFDREQRRPLSGQSNVEYDGLSYCPGLTRSEPRFSPEHTSRSNRPLPPIAEESDSLCAGDSSSSESEDFWSAKSTAELTVLSLD